MTMKLKIIRRCNVDQELPKIINYGVEITKSTTVVTLLFESLEGVVEYGKELPDNSGEQDMDFGGVQPEDSAPHIPRLARRVLRLVLSPANRSNIILRKDSDLYVYEIARTLEDCKAIYANTIRFKRGDKVSLFDRHARKWEIGTIKDISWKVINNKSTLINEMETEREKKIILVETKELVPYSPKMVEVHEVVKVPMYNRYAKEDGTRTYLEFPKMVTFGMWCTCSQVISEVLLQARHYMASYTESKRTLSRQFVSISLKKEALVHCEENQTVGLPFEVTLIDLSTEKCAICSSRQFTGEPQGKKCSGCKLPDKNVPIRGILKYFGGIAVCLNWIDTSQYGLQKETEDVNIKSIDIKDSMTPTLHNCLKLLFKPVLKR
eukprot:TRINITY_DN8617_c0_g1_i1.p1 TRINITY_DN8617_c0_g1~~TRINITY_DN8617_c0_g1_i1.p1  ORF type:complete len:379 (+),score=64.91 TRINITY_DN8617_c0_g1_i1:1385-2521(+)